MRVAVITPHLPPVSGGIASFSRELIRGLISKRTECHGFGRQGVATAEWDVIAGGSLRFIWSVFLALLNSRPNVVHAHAHWYALLPGVMIRTVFPSTRLVFTHHTQPVGRTDASFAVLRFLTSFCTAVTFVSRDLQRRAQPVARPAQFITYPAPEPAALQPVNHRNFSDRFPLRGHEVVAFVGPLVWPLKVEGVRRLVKSFRVVSQRHPSARLLIVGDGPLRDGLETFARNLLGSHVVFTGNVENAMEAFASCHVYAHISLQEGLPISLLNAMALGKAVLTTSTGGIPEVVTNGQTGLVVPPNPTDISAALDRLLSDPALRSRLGRAAADHVRNTFSWDKTIDLVLRCYRGVS